jgi:cysteine-rich repeat protein
MARLIIDILQARARDPRTFVFAFLTILGMVGCGQSMNPQAGTGGTTRDATTETDGMPWEETGAGGSSGTGGRVADDATAGRAGNDGGAWGTSVDGTVDMPGTGRSGTETGGTTDGGGGDVSSDSSPDQQIGGIVGSACTPLGTLACNGPNQQQTLICNAGKWQILNTCATGQRCDQSTGLCVTVLAQCDEHEPGYAFCQDNTLLTCGKDLVSVTTTACDGVCTAGTCQPPRCGDGRIEGSEECDDGNLIVADGCEPNCVRTKVLKLAAGSTHTCALLTAGNVRCWGGNEYGQLGLGTTAVLGDQEPYQNSVIQLGAAATDIEAGADHTCALMTDQSVRCWGKNDHGQLGLGHTDPIGDDELPSAGNATIALGGKATTIATGGNCTCSILDDKTLRCWGQNSEGQLGLGHTNDIGDNEVPTQALAGVYLGDDPALLVTTGGNHTCAIVADGKKGRCWGKNGLGQLGLGITDNVGDDELPTDVDPIIFPSDAAITSIAAGASRTCALRSNGTEYCWGDNSDGGLGIALTGADPLRKATAWGLFVWNASAWTISAGALHMCATFSNNDLRCWGINDKIMRIVMLRNRHSFMEFILLTDDARGMLIFLQGALSRGRRRWQFVGRSRMPTYDSGTEAAQLRMLRLSLMFKAAGFVHGRYPGGRQPCRCGLLSRLPEQCWQYLRATSRMQWHASAGMRVHITW